MIRRPQGDDGTIIPLILLAFVVAGLVITGSIAAGSAFLAQRDLQSVCDGAAIAAAQILNDEPYYRNSEGLSELPLGDVQSAAERYADEDAAGGPRQVQVSAAVQTDGTTVRVLCASHVDIPFEGVFSPGGLDRRASASAESTVRALSD